MSQPQPVIEYGVFGSDVSVDWSIISDDKELDVLGAQSPGAVDTRALGDERDLGARQLHQVAAAQPDVLGPQVAGGVVGERLGDLTGELGVELGVVVGGGNIFRGVEVSERGVPRPVGDTMGMLATVMNCLVLEAAIERGGREARTLSESLSSSWLPARAARGNSSASATPTSLSTCPIPMTPRPSFTFADGERIG